MKRRLTLQDRCSESRRFLVVGPVQRLLLLGFNHSPQLCALGSGITQFLRDRFFFGKRCVFELLLQPVYLLLGAVKIGCKGL